MTRRRIALGLGAAAGGLLGAALAPAAVALADSFDVDPVSYSVDPSSTDTFNPAGYTFNPVNPETVTGLYNFYTAPPGVNETLQGYQPFDVMDGNTQVGTFYAYESTAPYLGPNAGDTSNLLSSSQVLYVSPDVPGYQDPTGTAPPAGSVISTTWSYGHAFENVYSAIPGATPGQDVVTDTLKTPLGNVDLSHFINALGFDAAHVTPALPSYITGVGDPVVTAINGLPPLTIAEQGTQQFNYDPTDGPGGTFGGVETTTEDGFGFHTEAILVTSSSDNGPAVGTVYNTIDFHNLSNVYTSTPGVDGAPDKVTDILTIGNGKPIDLSWLFQNDDASKGLLDGTNIQPFSFDGYTIDAAPDAQETFTGINGLPPGNASFQGVQTFDFTHGTDTGTFNADVTTMPTMAESNFAEALLVTSSSDPTTVPVGSVFDVSTYPGGWENIYADLAGAGANGHNLITDTLVTPWGTDIDLSWLLQGTDAAAGLNPSDGLVSFLDGAWLDLFHLF